MSLTHRSFTASVLPVTPGASPTDLASGALLGLAVGNALGVGHKTTARDEGSPVTDMLGGGRYDLAPGVWTDETAMALSLADSLIAEQELADSDVMDRFVRWWQHGENSVTGTSLDVCAATAAALQRHCTTGGRAASHGDKATTGATSLTRLAPVVIAAESQATALDWAARQSHLTHAGPMAIGACRFLATLMFEALEGERLEAVLAVRSWSGEPAAAALAAGAWKTMSRAQIDASGHVIHILEAALWAVGGARSFEDALVRAVNLGGRTGSVGAVAGQLAGAIWGASAIPPRWLAALAWRHTIASLAAKLTDVRDHRRRMRPL